MTAALVHHILLFLHLLQSILEERTVKLCHRNSEHGLPRSPPPREATPSGWGEERTSLNPVGQHKWRWRCCVRCASKASGCCSLLVRGGCSQGWLWGRQPSGLISHRAELSCERKTDGSGMCYIWIHLLCFAFDLILSSTKPKFCCISSYSAVYFRNQLHPSHLNAE